MVSAVQQNSCLTGLGPSLTRSWSWCGHQNQNSQAQDVFELCKLTHFHCLDNSELRPLDRFIFSRWKIGTASGSFAILEVAFGRSFILKDVESTSVRTWKLSVDLLHVSLKRFAPKVLWSSKGCSCSPRSFYSMFALCSPSKFSFWSRTTHTRTYKQAILAKLTCFFSTRLQAKTLAHFRWNEERNCWHIETVQYSWGHVHPWGDKGYSLKTCKVKVFTWAIEIQVIT